MFRGSEFEHDVLLSCIYPSCAQVSNASSIHDC